MHKSYVPGPRNQSEQPHVHLSEDLEDLSISPLSGPKLITPTLKASLLCLDILTMNWFCFV